MKEHYSVCIVGAGPGGISLAIELIELGLEGSKILILEKGAVAVDAIRQFYPDKKMTIANYKGLTTETLGHIPRFPDLTKAQTLSYFDELIRKYRLNIRYNAEVSKVSTRDGMQFVQFHHEEITADFVGVGIGILGRPNKPDYKTPNSLRDHVLYDLTSQKVENKKVLVVGGGDTSSEYCQVLVDEGNQVTLCYRGDSFKRMMEQNRTAVYELEAQKRLRVVLNCSITEVKDEGGKPKVIFANEAPAEIFDKIIYSIGGTTPVNFLKLMGIEFEKDWPKVNESGETNVKGIYLLGDLVVGKVGGSIITAYNAAFKSAKDILQKMKATS